MEDFEKAMSLSLYYLGRRARSCQEMRDYLAKKEVREEVAEAVIARLLEYRYLDDAALAHRLAQSRIDKGGRRKVEMELRRRGIDQDTVQEALDALEEDQELLSAVAWARKSLSKPTEDPRKARQRAFAALARRGYSTQVALEALRIASGEDGD